MGKLTDVAIVPSGVVESDAVGVDWAHAAVAVTNNNNPIFFMLPPRRDTPHPFSNEMPWNQGFNWDGNKGVRGGQGYEGVRALWEIGFFRAILRIPVASAIKPL